MPRNTSVTLQVNCGFARVAVYTLSSSRCEEDLITSFKKRFDFQLPDDYCLADNGRKSRFQRHCDFILTGFHKKWYPLEQRKLYLDTFSMSKWSLLSFGQKSKHSLSNCIACYNEHSALQEAFPLGPYFKPDLPSISFCAASSEKQTTRQILGQLNKSFEEKYKHTFVESAIKYCGKEESICHRKDNAEKKKEQRKAQRSFKKSVEAQFSKNAAINHLTESESFSAYNRKRLNQSFIETKKTRIREHIPSASTIDSYTDIVLQKLNEWPKEKQMNWSELGRECGINGGNKGQVAKGIALKNGVDIQHWEKNRKASTRKSKAKLPGQDISMPSIPTVGAIKIEINDLITKGELNLGEPCCPFTLVKTKVVNGELNKTACKVFGRKISLIDVRKSLLQKQENYMNLLTDEEVEKLTENELVDLLHQLNMQTDGDLRSKLKDLQRVRTLALWHDHSTILGSGYILMTIHVIYDPAVFITNTKFKEMSKNSGKNIQSIIEEPELYMLCLSSSSSDQLATISDRLDCLADLSLKIQTSNGVMIHDELRFFCGDHPAQAFERGSQIGGNYKCGSCGCLTKRMNDFAHVSTLQWRSLNDLQDIVIAGKFGKKPGVLKPFEKLKKNELQEELRSRHVFDISGNRNELLSILHDTILKGTQRVPTILITNPCMSLSDMNLSHYMVLDCEPLHDLKGHLINLLTELPHILPSELKKKSEDLLSEILYCKKQNGYSGSDLRVALIETYKYLYNDIKETSLGTLLETATKMSHLLYSFEENRTPKAILQFYNCTWIHHEVCKDLFSSLHNISMEKFFGAYLHALVIHAPQQFEIMCLRSANTENQERMFQQAKKIALNATNRKPENVIPSILLRIQAKQLTGKISMVYESAETNVSRVAKDLPIYNRSFISHSFVRSRMSSWQAHLERISPYLIVGKGKWWRALDSGYEFFDGHQDTNAIPDGPPLRHFRSTSIKEVQANSRDSWKLVIKNKVIIPITEVREFTEDGNLIGISAVNQDPQVAVEQPTTDRSPPSKRMRSLTFYGTTVQDTCNNRMEFSSPVSQAPLRSSDITTCSNASNQLFTSTTSPLRFTPVLNTERIPAKLSVSENPILHVSNELLTTTPSRFTPLSSTPRSCTMDTPIPAISESPIPHVSNELLTTTPSRFTPLSSTPRSCTMDTPIPAISESPIPHFSNELLTTTPSRFTPLSSTPRSCTMDTPIPAISESPIPQVSLTSTFSRCTTTNMSIPNTKYITSTPVSRPKQNVNKRKLKLVHVSHNEDEVEHGSLPNADEDDVQVAIEDCHEGDCHEDRYKSKHAALISKALNEECEDLAIFDNLHVKIKTSKPTKSDMSTYKDILARIQLQVIKKRKALFDTISNSEKEFYKQHGRLPIQDEEHTQLYKQLKYIKTLLRNWHITV